MLLPIFVPSQSPSLTQFEVNTNNETQSLLSPDQLAEDLLPLVPIPPIPVSGGDICPKQSCVMKPTIEDVCDSEDDEDEEIDELMQGHLSCSSSGVPDWSYLHNKIDKVLDKEKKVCCLPYSQVSSNLVYQDITHEFSSLTSTNCCAVLLPFTLKGSEGLQQVFILPNPSMMLMELGLLGMSMHLHATFKSMSSFQSSTGVEGTKAHVTWRMRISEELHEAGYRSKR